MRHIVLLATVALLMTSILALLGAGMAAAHPHEVSNPSHDQVIANGQNHPGFVTDSETGVITMCEGVNEPVDSGPAGYGLETAHHWPNAGTAGKGDGCYAVEDDAPPPPDTNPAIDWRTPTFVRLKAGLMSPALLEGGGVYEAHPVLLLAAMALTLAVASGVALAVNEIDTNGPDTLRGTNGDDNLSRNGANDVLWGGGGKDNLLGGTGNDIVLSGNEHRFFSRGDQNLVGGSGNDTVIGGLHKAGPSTSS